MTCSELILSPDETRLVERKRYPGENTLAMVAWKMILRTPGMMPFSPSSYSYPLSDLIPESPQSILLFILKYLVWSNMII